MNSLARIVTLAMMVMLITAVPAIEGNSSGKHSQAGQGCTCHSSVATVVIGHNFPTTYIAGAMYSITVSIQTGGSPTNGGFNVEIDKGQLMSPGAGVKIDQAQTSATHTNSNQITWSFEWMAPFGSAGIATVDMAVMEANSNGGTSGDAWSTLQVQISEGLPPNDAPSLQTFKSHLLPVPKPTSRSP